MPATKKLTIDLGWQDAEKKVSKNKMPIVPNFLLLCQVCILLHVRIYIFHMFEYIYIYIYIF